MRFFGFIEKERMGLCGFNEKERMKRRLKKENVFLVFKFVFLVFLFKIQLDLKLCNFWFLIMLFIFYLVKTDNFYF